MLLDFPALSWAFQNWTSSCTKRPKGLAKAAEATDKWQQAKVSKTEHTPDKLHIRLLTRSIHSQHKAAAPRISNPNFPKVCYTILSAPLPLILQ